MTPSNRVKVDGDIPPTTNARKLLARLLLKIGKYVEKLESLELLHIHGLGKYVEKLESLELYSWSGFLSSF